MSYLKNLKVGDMLYSPKNNLFNYKVVKIGTWEQEQMLLLLPIDKQNGKTKWGCFVIVNDFSCSMEVLKNE